jgi:anthranilate phosphoribosyltransferase
MSEDFSPLLKRVVVNESLDPDTAAHAFDLMTSGTVPDVQIAAFLTALEVRGPTVNEIVGAARAMRAKMKKIETSPHAIDVCGTGGDGHGTLNISTAVSLVVAACGVPVAKHGNRSMSSKSGTADILEQLGVKIDLEPEAASRVLRDAGMVFLFAQSYHPAMKHVANVRRTLGFRTIFNLLGPLANPAWVRRQLIGVFSSRWVDRLTDVLRLLGTEAAWVVHGGDGLDELTTTQSTSVGILKSGSTLFTHVSPEDAGLPRTSLSDLKCGAPQENAIALRRLLDGETGAYRDIVLFNAAAALIIADKVKDLREGAVMAAAAIDTGATKRTLEKLIAASNA